MKSHSTFGRSKPQPEYEEPKTEQEAELRQIDLVTDLQVIDAQLIDPDLKKGRSHKEWQAWRTRALRAKAIKTGELQKLKLWIKHNKVRYRERLIRMDGSDPGDPLSMMGGLLKLVKRLIKLYGLDDEILDTEFRIMDQAEAMITGEEYESV